MKKWYCPDCRSYHKTRCPQQIGKCFWFVKITNHVNCKPNGIFYGGLRDAKIGVDNRIENPKFLCSTCNKYIEDKDLHIFKLNKKDGFVIDKKLHKGCKNW